MLSRPWAYYKKDQTGSFKKDPEGQLILDGYNVDIIKKLSDIAGFSYDIIVPSNIDSDYGEK